MTSRRVMRGCQCETGLKCSLRGWGGYYIMAGSRLARWQQSNMPPWAGAILLGDGWMNGILMRGSRQVDQREVGVTLAHINAGPEITVSTPPPSLLRTQEHSHNFGSYLESLISKDKYNILRGEIITKLNK